MQPFLMATKSLRIKSTQEDAFRSSLNALFAGIVSLTTVFAWHPAQAASKTDATIYNTKTGKNISQSSLVIAKIDKTPSKNESGSKSSANSQNARNNKSNSNERNTKKNSEKRFTDHTGDGLNAISGWKILNLDLDHSVSAQKKVSELIDYRKDLYPASDSIRLWTGSKGLRILRSSIEEMRGKFPNDKWLTFVGSGDFHQVTATLIETLPKSSQPVTIILFDNHPDWFKAPAHYHCGAWVVQALKHPWVDQVIMVAQDSSDIRGDQFRFAPFNELCTGRVQMHPLSHSAVFVPLVWRAKVAGVESCKRSFLGTRLKFATVRGVGVSELAQRLAKQLAGKNVYVTIDKDVLDQEFAITDWDQGTLTLKEMLSIISTIAESANLVGMDVCGERAPDPIHGIFKSFDSGRQFKRKIKNFQQATEVNEPTNLEIIKMVRESADAKKSVTGTVELKPKK